jgi:hypothetical protein
MGRWSFIQHIEPDSQIFWWVVKANFQHYNLIDDNLLKDWAIYSFAIRQSTTYRWYWWCVYGVWRWLGIQVLNISYVLCKSWGGGWVINLMFVVPYGGLERKPTQNNNQLSYRKEERGWFDHWRHYINGEWSCFIKYFMLRKQHLWGYW